MEGSASSVGATWFGSVHTANYSACLSDRLGDRVGQVCRTATSGLACLASRSTYDARRDVMRSVRHDSDLPGDLATRLAAHLSRFAPFPGPRVTSYPTQPTKLAIGYRRLLDGGNVVDFAAEVSSTYQLGTLHRLLAAGVDHDRRAAAFILGVFGHRSSQDALGVALADGDRAVRILADDSLSSVLMRDASPSARHQLMRLIHLLDGDSSSACIEPLRFLTAAHPGYAEAWYQRGVALAIEGRLQAASRSHRRCLDLCRHHHRASMAMAVISMRCDDTRSAVSYLRQTLDICPDNEPARLRLRRLEHRLSGDQSGGTDLRG